MYMLNDFDDFVGLGQTSPTCPPGYVFANGACTLAQQVAAAPGAVAAPAAPAQTAYEVVTSATKCAASDCNCMYSKAVNNIEYYNTANKTAKDYQTYKTNFALRYNEYLKCAQAAGMQPVQLNINTPPPGVTFSAPGAGANALASGGVGSSLLSTAGSLLAPGGAGSSLLPGGAGAAPGGGSEMGTGEKIGIAVGAALLLGGLVLLMTGKKKGLVPAMASTHASPVPGVLPAGNITIDVGGGKTSARKSSRRRRYYRY
jgi:hypothetical protein